MDQVVSPLSEGTRKRKSPMSWKANSCLSLSLKTLLRKLKSAKNVAVSPLSLDAAVAMLGAGMSRPLDELLSFAECESVDELKSMFGKALEVATSSGEGCPTISFVNAAWIDSCFSFQPEYEDCLNHTFKIEATPSYDFVKQVDELVNAVNSWADSKTNGLIKSIITREQLKQAAQGDGDRVAVILTNALYFKGFWKNKFNPELTKKRDFYLINGDKIPDVPFMSSSKRYGYGSFDEYKVLEIPYQQGESSSGKQFCMQIVLPHEKDGLQSLLDKFNADASGLQFLLEYTVLDDLRIPKFKFSSSHTKEDIGFPFLEDGKVIKLAKMLQNMEDRVFKLDVIQKAFIEVDDKGTEAAAVTRMMGIMCGSSRYSKPKPRKTFVADHPFLFVIKETESGLVLFVGTVLNPLEE